MINHFYIFFYLFFSSSKFVPFLRFWFCPTFYFIHRDVCFCFYWLFNFQQRSFHCVWDKNPCCVSWCRKWSTKILHPACDIQTSARRKPPTTCSHSDWAAVSSDLQIGVTQKSYSEVRLMISQQAGKRAGVKPAHCASVRLQTTNFTTARTRACFVDMSASSIKAQKPAEGRTSLTRSKISFNNNACWNFGPTRQLPPPPAAPAPASFHPVGLGWSLAPRPCRKLRWSCVSEDAADPRCCDWRVAAAAWGRARSNAFSQMDGCLSLTNTHSHTHMYTGVAFLPLWAGCPTPPLGPITKLFPSLGPRAGSPR